jgi:AcrR family transcriptional regulator
MKAEAVRPLSQRDAARHDLRVEDKIAHRAERRESKRLDSPRDRRDSRWDEHRRTRREQLVQATLAAVSKHGAAVGMEEIAAEAGTSKTVVYRHFTDRSQLHMAVCARVAERLLTELRAAMQTGGHPRRMIADAIETYLAFCEADPELYRFVVHPPQGQSGHFGPDPIGSLSDLVAEEASAVLAEALAAAGRDPAVARPWGHGLVGLVRASADWWLQAGRPMIRSELATHLTDLAWAGLSGVVPSQEEA